MCAVDPISLGLMAAGTGLQMFQANQQQNAQAAMEQYQSQVANNNAAIAQQQAQNAESQGQLALEQQQDKNSATLGMARAQTAANGLDLNMGSPLAVQTSDQTLGDLDAQNIRDNTIDQAYGDDASAMNDQAKAQLYQSQADMTNWNQNMGYVNLGMSNAPTAYGVGTDLAGALS